MNVGQINYFELFKYSFIKGIENSSSCIGLVFVYYFVGCCVKAILSGSYRKLFNIVILIGLFASFSNEIVNNMSLHTNYILQNLLGLFIILLDDSTNKSLLTQRVVNSFTILFMTLLYFQTSETQGFFSLYLPVVGNQTLCLLSFIRSCGFLLFPTSAAVVILYFRKWIHFVKENHPAFFRICSLYSRGVVGLICFATTPVPSIAYVVEFFCVELFIFTVYFWPKNFDYRSAIVFTTIIKLMLLIGATFTTLMAIGNYVSNLGDSQSLDTWRVWRSQYSINPNDNDVVFYGTLDENNEVAVISNKEIQSAMELGQKVALVDINSNKIGFMKQQESENMFSIFASIIEKVMYFIRNIVPFVGSFLKGSNFWTGFLIWSHCISCLLVIEFLTFPQFQKFKTD
ncbi:uncharacterized protein MONOS_18645 [Monocercomonoides exilis]|uniref:uncharacterized protein n=1 Tax=Monocercomonoides exilis TaxID=2049356 RepID=UPI00355A91D0|nr:hypothetical protein MONOS_18645 [Monocercomonoides exilis]